MKKTNKKAFSLAELLMTTVLMFVVIALITPALQNNFNTDKSKLRFAYSQILKITAELLADPQIYPDAQGFYNISTYKDPMTGEEYSGNYKFTNLFRSKLNILEEITDSKKLQKIKDTILLGNEYSKKYTYCDGNCSQATCFKTSSKITYCIPKNTIASAASKPGFRLLSGKSIGYIVIHIYLTDEMTPQKGYYVKLDTKGEVSVLPVMENHNPLLLNSRPINCHDNNDYKTYNQCRMDDMLLYTTVDN